MIRYTDIQCALNVLHEAKTEINERKNENGNKQLYLIKYTLVTILGPICLHYYLQEVTS